MPLVSLNDGQQRLVKLAGDASQRDSQKEGLERVGSVGRQVNGVLAFLEFSGVSVW